MKNIKTLFLLALTALTANAWASSSVASIKCMLTSVPSTLDKTLGTLYSDGTPILENEVLRVLWVFPKKGASFDITKNLSYYFDIDSSGEVVPLEGTANIFDHWEWGVTANDQTYLPANDTASFGTQIDRTIRETSPYYGSYNVEFVCKNERIANGQYPYMYFVAFDRRAANEETLEVGMGRVVKWGAILYPTLYSPTSLVGGLVRFIFNDTKLGGRTAINFPTPTIATVLPESYTDANGKTLTGDDLTAYLTPSVDAISAPTEQDDGGFTLTCTSNDVCTYTLQTKASLSDDWMSMDEAMDEVIENLDQEVKNSLANKKETCYTHLRVKESTQIRIPRIPNETQRFYRLIAE